MYFEISYGLKINLDLINKIEQLPIQIDFNMVLFDMKTYIVIDIKQRTDWPGHFGRYPDKPSLGTHYSKELWKNKTYQKTQKKPRYDME